jgi:Asp-tRNA(Asn)/Glu-tRNA(Gln) amidotransferase A subunit family amidase
MSKRFSTTIAVALMWLTTVSPARAQGFAFLEATIASTHAAFAAGSLDCETLVEGYLDRIAAYDRQGPALQSVIALNTDALDEARALDLSYAEQDAPTGPLHCVPIVLKDNIDLAGMATTAGATALAGARPPDDAFVVARLRAAGAIVLGKANLDEFAFGFTGSSSLGGLVRNPYDPSRGAGGSSSGTAAAVAASLAMLGLGTDTGGSIRVPSSVTGLVGIRPSMRRLSQDGILPLARFQDTVGPMCRVVEDCALALDVMTGFDSGTFSGQHTQPMQRDDEAVRMTSAASYDTVVGTDRMIDALDPSGLAGARIGVVRALFGDDPDVVATMEAAIGAMRDAGSTVEDVTIGDLDTILGYASVSRWEFRDHLTAYLRAWPSDADAHPRSFEEVAASLGYETARVRTFVEYGANGATRSVDPEYERNTRERSTFVRARIQSVLDNGGYDALLYPSVLGLPAVGGPPPTGSNNRLSPFTGFPALTMPAGFTAETPARVALPVGMELLAREFDEATLVRLAFAYQEKVRGTPAERTPPTFTPESP